MPEILKIQIDMALSSVPITISSEARKEILDTLSRKNIPPGYGLRVGVRGGGCAQPTLFIGFDQPKPGDDRYDLGQFELLVEKKHLMHLIGVKVDFVDSDLERGFLLTYPE